MKLTVICQEEGFPDTLIYVVDVANPQKQYEVQAAIQKERERDLGEDVANEVTPLFAFQGDLMLYADWRD